MSDWEFIFDGVFGFLSSPLWGVPVLTFIESQSVVFEPREENHLSWTEIHNKYKSLVESLLTSFLNDLGITEQQFMKACSSSGAQNAPQMQTILEQIWAAEDFEIFKRMMIQKNVELQLEALQLIQKRQGVKSKPAEKVKPDVSDEDRILQEVMRRSQLEYEGDEKKKKAAEEKKEFNPSLEKIISESHIEADRLEKEVLMKQEETKKTVTESIERTKQKEEKSYDKKEVEKKPTEKKTELKPVVKPSSPPLVKVSDVSKVKYQNINNGANSSPVKETTATSADAAASWMASAREENASSQSTSKAQPELTEDDVEKRVKYLKEQRNRLLAIKKEKREKQLTEYTRTQPQRPASAQAAKQAVTGSINQELSAEEQKKIAMRKALAEKLKKEVVYK